MIRCVLQRLNLKMRSRKQSEEMAPLCTLNRGLPGLLALLLTSMVHAVHAIHPQLLVLRIRLLRLPHNETCTLTC